MIVLARAQCFVGGMLFGAVCVHLVSPNDNPAIWAGAVACGLMRLLYEWKNPTR